LILLETYKEFTTENTEDTEKSHSIRQERK